MSEDTPQHLLLGICPEAGCLKKRWAAIMAAALLLVGCDLPQPALSEEARPLAMMQAAPSPTITRTPVIATLSPAPSSTPTSTLTPTSSPTPFGCERPPDDVTRVKVGDDMLLNQRTVWMLERAQELYGGSLDFMKAVTQGSYHAGVSASFGTHDGGGAVDLSVRDPNDWNHVLYEEMELIIESLRRAGFAAWLRDTGDLYANSPVHIHAIAIGDPELSEAAQRQISGIEGYLRGLNGLPVNPPIADNFGGPIICPWMIEMGYSDLQ